MFWNAKVYTGVKKTLTLVCSLSQINLILVEDIPISFEIK